MFNTRGTGGFSPLRRRKISLQRPHHPMAEMPKLRVLPALGTGRFHPKTCQHLLLSLLNLPAPPPVTAKFARPPMGACHQFRQSPLPGWSCWYSIMKWSAGQSGSGNNTEPVQPAPAAPTQSAEPDDPLGECFSKFQSLD